MLATVLTGQQVLNMLTDAATLFVLASGLGVIFGLMNVINFAQGAFIAIGAYIASLLTQHSVSPWLLIPAGVAIGAGCGLVVELAFIRRLYTRPWDTILATIGLQLVIVAALSLIFGLGNRYVGSPLKGQIDLGFTTYSSYRIFIVGVAVALGLLWVATERFTRLGLIARAVMAQETLASTLGIDTRIVRRVTFVIGCGLAGLGGATVAPITAVQPNMGDQYLVSAFLIVLVAGSSVSGLALASLILGGLESWVTFLTSPIVGNIAIIVLAAAILRLVPGGLQQLTAPSWAAIRRPRPRLGRG